MDKVLFGERLKHAREASGMSQKLLASRLGVKCGTVKKWESGKEDPRANRLQMIASLLNVPLVWLLAGGQELPEPSSERSAEQLMQQKLTEVNDRMQDLKNSIEDLAVLVQNNP